MAKQRRPLGSRSSPPGRPVPPTSQSPNPLVPITIILLALVGLGILWAIVSDDSQNQSSAPAASSQQGESEPASVPGKEQTPTPPASLPAGPVATSPTPSATAPSGDLAWKFAYDDAGRMTSAIDQAGRRTTWQYVTDDKGLVRQVTRQTENEPPIIARFNETGRRVEMMDALGVIRYAWDARGRLTAIRRDGAAPVVYAYDDSASTVAITVGAGPALRYRFDSSGQLDAIDTPAGSIGRAARTDDRTVARTFPNGIRGAWTYGPGRRLQSIVYSRGHETLLAFAYSYRPDGRVSQAVESSPQGQRTLKYDYDIAGRLTAVDDSKADRMTWSYDPCGNCTSSTQPGRPSILAAYDWAGRPTQLNGASCQHDAASNLTGFADPAGPRTLTYGSHSELLSAAAGPAQVHYEYDGDGNLCARRTGDSAYTLIPDPTSDTWRPLAAIAPDGTQTLYIWDGEVLLATVQGSRTRVLLHDRLGSIRAMAESTPDSIQRFDYDPFGVPRNLSPNQGLMPGFASLFYDPGSQLYITRARAYDPALGRFLQIDPEHRVPRGSQMDLSAYAYCGGDPVNFVDPDGLSPQDPEVRIPQPPDLHYSVGIEWTPPGAKELLRKFIPLGPFDAKTTVSIKVSTEYKHTPLNNLAMCTMPGIGMPLVLALRSQNQQAEVSVKPKVRITISPVCAP